MTNTVIKVENLSKQYRLGLVGTGTLWHDMQRWWHLARGKEDPYLKIGETNKRDIKGDSEYVWALKDVNFEVKQGEVLGIIGKNGAGKSTLLKILSRITTPTTGEFKVKGRISSLLEVGTGFHPELTGRENVFLNGSILGMRKAEIKAKFDEIIAFSGVERYIDTPVKRYSSGMYVRLAFAVAAHLEPEILIIDEVLAVGDAEFQKKCLGKVKDVAGEGRTVLFVSHSMPSIRALCSTVMYLQHGTVMNIGEKNKVIAEYLSLDEEILDRDDGIIPPNLSRYNTGEAKFKKLLITSLNDVPKKELFFKENFTLNITLDVLKDIENVVILVFILNNYGETVLMAIDNECYAPSDYKQGTHHIKVTFKESLMPGNYSVGLSIAYFHTGNSIDSIESFAPFKVVKETEDKSMEYPWSTIHGYTLPKTEWIKRS